MQRKCELKEMKNENLLEPEVSQHVVQQQWSHYLKKDTSSYFKQFEKVLQL